MSSFHARLALHAKALIRRIGWGYPGPCISALLPKPGLVSISGELRIGGSVQGVHSSDLAGPLEAFKEQMVLLKAPEEETYCASIGQVVRVMTRFTWQEAKSQLQTPDIFGNDQL